MRLRIVFIGTVAKDDSPDAVNEDQVATDEISQRFAVSDGASESYDSSRWARLLSAAWVTKEIAATRCGLDHAISEYERAVDPASLSWSKKGAFDRGSFATLLGVSLCGDSARIIAIGDSLALAVGLQSGPQTFPYSLPEEFDCRPVLLSTQRQANAALFNRSIARGWITRWPLQPGTALLLMTDALGQWLLRHNADVCSRTTLLNLRHVDDMKSFVRSEQSSGAMRRDDTTLIHLAAEEA